MLMEDEHVTMQALRDHLDIIYESKFPIFELAIQTEHLSILLN